jgi:UDP-N-acetylmuramyl tripeptide synthase
VALTAVVAGVARPVAAALDGLLRRLPLADAPDPAFEAGVALARLLGWVDRRTNERIDVSRPGRALLAAEPRAIARLARRLPEGTVVVSGTNGKTTTTNLLALVMAEDGRRPVVNRIGANMAGGIAAVLAAAARFPGRIDGDVGVFEVDELWLERVLPDLAPRVVVLTNLFRDQLDRMGEVDQVADHWDDVFAGSADGPALVVCADDPRLARVGRNGGLVVSFGKQATGAGRSVAADVADCRGCGSPLDVGPTHIGHLGAWRCPSCGAERRTPDVEAVDVEVNDLEGSRFVVTTRAGAEDAAAPVELPLPGRFNVANAVAALAGATVFGIAPHRAAPALAAARTAFGRAERLEVDGRPVVLLLAKNPVGADELVALLAARQAVDLLVVLNDRDIDGRDVSWIWDVDIEALAPVVRTATCSGRRASDAALRLAVAGVPSEVIEVLGPVEGGLARAAARAEGELVVLANYTAMLEVRELVAELGHAPRYWA